MGIFFAFLALICWGVGDFLIQKSTRKVGDLVALFYITLFGAIILLPFAAKDLPRLFSLNRLSLLVLFGAAVVILIAAILDFKALRIGKMSVVEPVFALEIPVTAVIAALVLGEYLTGPQILMVLLLFFGIILVSVKRLADLKKIKLEAGVWLAVLATLLMGGVNFLMGWGARLTDPLLINWFINFFIVTVLAVYFISTGQLAEVGWRWRENKKLILAVSLIDTLAWVFFTMAVIYIPIAIATSFSESYIALAAVLGLVLNREKLMRHQQLGLAVCILAVIVLALITN